MIASLGSHAVQSLSPEAAITVDRSRCVRHRCNRNDCRDCLDACPAGAITWGALGLRIDPDACTDCLNCLAACPTAALQSPAMSLPRTLNELAAQVRPVLGCHRHSSSEAHARVPCLGCLADAETMMLLALTFPDGLQINLTECGDCSNRHIVDGLRKAQARLSDLRPGHKVKLVVDRQALDFKPPELSRRELFAAFRQRSTRAAAAVVQRFDADEPSSSFGDKQLPTRRRLLRKSLAGLPEADRVAIAGALFGQISFTPACDACGGCVGVCPTGAIRPSGVDGAPPKFHPSFCVECRSCQAFCREQGIVSGLASPPTGDGNRLAEAPGPSAAVGQ